MEGKRRVIIFLSLVTLSSGQELNFEFTEKGYAAVLEAERLHDVGFRPTEEELWLEDTEDLHEWVATGDVIRVGETITRKIIPADPEEMSTLHETKDNDGELLSYMLMSFSKVSYELPNIWNPDIIDTVEVTYGKLAICFVDRLRDYGEYPESARETCLYTLMFSLPEAWCHQEYMRASNAVWADPISAEQINELIHGKPMSWKLGSLPYTLLVKPAKEAFLLDDDSDRTSNVARSLYDEGAAYYLKPIIVLEEIIKKYYQFVTTPNQEP